MTRAPGHDPGHAGGEAPIGYSWADYVAHLVLEHGTLAAVALRLAERATTPEDSATVERALRRLRGRGQQDGGDYGRRLLRAFGLPASIEARVKWMGVYHSRFCDLPRSLCREQLRLWDRPPTSESRARVWIELGLASTALRGRELDVAEVHLRRARAGSGELAARIELALVDGFLASHRGDGGRIDERLREASELLIHGEGALTVEDRACLEVRVIDQRAYQLNRGGDEQARAALALYDGLSRVDSHPFVSYRRDAGRAYGYYKLGQREAAVVLAEAAIAHAGDGGYVRLRAMGLQLLARILGDEAGASARARALAIARRLEDEALLGRIERA